MGAWEELVAGEFFNSVVTPFSSIIGTEVFYLILWVSALGILFMRTKNWGLVIIALMVTSFAVVDSILPQFERYLIIFVIGGIVYLTFDIFKSKR